MQYSLILTCLSIGFWLLPEYPVISTVISGLGFGICFGLVLIYLLTTKKYKISLRETVINPNKIICWKHFVLLFFAVFSSFIDNLMPNLVLFSNDGPLGVMVADHLSTTYPGCPYWNDLHWLGSNGGVRPFSPTVFLTTSLGPIVVLLIFIFFIVFTFKPSKI